MPDETRSEETMTDETRFEETISHETKSEETMSDETRSEETMSHETKSKETMSHEARSKETMSYETRSEEMTLQYPVGNKIATFIGTAESSRHAKSQRPINCTEHNNSKNVSCHHAQHTAISESTAYSAGTELEKITHPGQLQALTYPLTAVKVRGYNIIITSQHSLDPLSAKNNRAAN